ncbi:chloride channel protein [Halodesulfovibrio sp.]|uniref:chloride channel protein n=1 Tax=Halodesulfovibrio sp. TaxID=1912772 RepID=UPI0025D30ED9|nr:chloride channel protein [Halodesulfovibrio sp.]MCT4536347.1 chloride channel protein [Halodesulfovibrio sp.]
MPQQNVCDSRPWFGVSSRINAYTPMLVLALGVGVLAGYGSVLFRYAIDGVQILFYHNGSDFLAFYHTLPWYGIVLPPAIGGAIVGLLTSKGAPEAKGHGVPEVMEAVALRDGVIRKRVAAVKIAASAICIGSGGSVGREGPIVQIGSSIGSTLGQLLKVNRSNQRTLVGCGAAAGIAATFNAPIAGIMFALEILLGDFGFASFSPVVLSSVTATAISRYYFGDFPAFISPVYELGSIWELGLFPILGIASALIAVLFVATLYKMEDLSDLIHIPPVLKAALGGLCIGGILLLFPELMGVGYGAITLSLMDKMAWGTMLILIFLKIFATSLTISSGGSGGIFAPSLFIGAMTGGVFGVAVHYLFPAVVPSPGIFALIGMGGLVAGTTYAPITAILIIFELTSNYHIILPLMLTCIISTLIASSISPGSIYTVKLMRRGVDLRDGMEQNILKKYRVRDLMQIMPDTLYEGATLQQVFETFRRKNAPYLHLVDKKGELSGIISFRDLRSVLAEEYLENLLIAKDIATTCIETVKSDDAVLDALHRMAEFSISQLPVVNVEGKLIGTLREQDVLAAYDQSVVGMQLKDAA